MHLLALALFSGQVHVVQRSAPVFLPPTSKPYQEVERYMRILRPGEKVSWQVQREDYGAAWSAVSPEGLSIDVRMVDFSLRRFVDYSQGTHLFGAKKGAPLTSGSRAKFSARAVALTKALTGARFVVVKDLYVERKSGQNLPAFATVLVVPPAMDFPFGQWCQPGVRYRFDWQTGKVVDIRAEWKLDVAPHGAITSASVAAEKARGLYNAFCARTGKTKAPMSKPELMYGTNDPLFSREIRNRVARLCYVVRFGKDAAVLRADTLEPVKIAFEPPQPGQ
jgi:hypothetical protein